MNAGAIDAAPLPAPRWIADREFGQPAASAAAVPTAHPSSDAWPGTPPGADRDAAGDQ